MTSTDNIIDAVVMCVCMNICQQVNPPKTKCLDPSLLKQLSIISVSIYWGKYCGKKIGEESCLPDKKICTDQRNCLDPSTISALLSAKLYNQS